MSPHQSDVADMQCWLVRMAQKRSLPASEATRIFRTHGIYQYIDSLYDLLCLSSYDCALDSIEKMLRTKGVLL